MTTTSDNPNQKRDWAKPVLTNINVSDTETGFGGGLSDMTNTSTASAAGS